MIYNQLNCIFVRIPRSASVSIRTFFSNIQQQELPIYEHRSLDPSPILDPHLLLDPHLTLSQIRRIIFTDDTYSEFRARYGSMFKFAFVRNPYDRFVSLYHYVKHGMEKSGKVIPCDISTFPMFIRNFDSYFIYWDWFTRKSQYEFTEGCNFVGRFENIECDFRKVCDMLKIDVKNRSLPFGNNSVHDHYSTYYDKKSIDFVYKIERLTIRRFKYEFCSA